MYWVRRIVLNCATGLAVMLAGAALACWHGEWAAGALTVAGLAMLFAGPDMDREAAARARRASLSGGDS